MPNKNDFMLEAGVKINADQANNEIKQFVEDVKKSFSNVSEIKNIQQVIKDLGATAVKDGRKVLEFYKDIGNQRVRFNVTKKGNVELGKDKVIEPIQDEIAE